MTEKRPLDTVAVGALARVLETVGLSMFLTYWGVSCEIPNRSIEQKYLTDMYRPAPTPLTKS